HVHCRVVAQERSARRHGTAAPLRLGRGDDRLRRDALGPSGNVLRRHAPDHRSSRRTARPQPDRLPSHHHQTREDPLMEDTHVHALDYLSVVRRRKWWLIMPIVASIAIGYALVRFLPKEYKGTAALGVVAPG